MALMIRYCRDCGRSQPFDQPHDEPGSCPDLPGADCLEWACTGCGAALFTVIPGLAAHLDVTGGPGRLRAGRVA